MIVVAGNLGCENGNRDGDVAIQVWRFALLSGQPANERATRHAQIATPALQCSIWL